MRVKIFSVVTGIVALLAVTTVFDSTSITQAQTQSEGCAFLNGPPSYTASDDPFRTYRIWSTDDAETMAFRAGEVIRVEFKVTPASPDIRAKIGVEMEDVEYNVIVDESKESTDGRTITTQQSFVVPESEGYRFGFVALLSAYPSYMIDAASIDANVSCTPVSSGERVGSPTIITPPDDRLNWRHGDTEAVVYDHEDGVAVYCHTDGETWLGMHVNQALVENADTSQPQQVPIYEVNEKGCRTAFYILDSGEYQINIWSDEGKIYEIIDDSIDFADPTMRYYDPNK